MTALPIRENCILGGLDMDLYHSQAVCAGPSFSSSNLRRIDQKSAAHMFAHWSGNPNRVEETTKPLNFGSAAHALILGDEVFEKRHVVSPFADFAKIEVVDGVTWRPRRPSMPAPSASKTAWSDYEKAMAAVEAGELAFKSDWKEQQEAAGRRIISPEDMQHIRNMAEVLASHPVTQDGVLQGEVEQSVFWEDGRGFWMKSRMDCRPLDDTLTDFKTANDASDFGCYKAVRDKGYDMQFALGAEGLITVAGQRISKFMCLFQEKEPPYAVMPYPISSGAIWRAAQRNEMAKREIAECLKTGEWPGYIPSEGYLLTRKQEERYAEMEKMGLMPDPPAWLEMTKEPA